MQLLPLQPVFQSGHRTQPGLLRQPSCDRCRCNRFVGLFDSGYGYGSLTELTEVPGTGMEVLQNPQKFRVRYGIRTELTEIPGRYTNVVPVPRVLWHRRAELTELSGMGMNVVQHSQRFRVRV